MSDDAPAGAVQMGLGAAEVLDGLREAVLILNGKFDILFANRALSNVLRVAVDEAAGRSLFSLGGSVWNDPKLRRDLSRVIVEGWELNDLEVEQDLEQKGKRYLVLNARRLMASAESVPMLLLAIQDVTEQRLANAERVRVQSELEKLATELARSNQDLERFAYVASHDLQEPLRMVASYTQLLARRYAGQLDARADKYIAYAVDGATRMQELVNGLLAYSRVSRQGEDFVPVACEQVLESVLRNLEHACRKTGAVVTHDALPTIRGNPTQLTQLLQNLISNALKFRGSEPPRVHVSARAAADQWLFSVRDNGIGIDPQYFQRIFVIFQRLHTREQYSGTGIGLALCKKIVEHHGGRLWVESAPGSGSTFLFTLPREVPEA